jgi:hypothetical protein
VSGKSGRRVAAGSLLLAGIASLAVPAVRLDAPLRSSVSLARKFWRANATSRLANSPFFSPDLDFVRALLTADRSLSLSADVVLTLPLELPAAEAEMRRRRAANLLAPRRVLLARGETGPWGFKIARAER